MAEKIKKHQRSLLTLLIALCVGTILFSGVRYLVRTRDRLELDGQQHAMDMALLQKQAIDDYIRDDRERLHRYAEFFSEMPVSGPKEILERLAMFADVNAADCGVVCLDEGLAYSSISDQVIQLDAATLEEYLGLTGSGVRDSFIGVFTGEPRFSYYETFTLANGHRGVLQKS